MGFRGDEDTTGQEQLADILQLFGLSDRQGVVGGDLWLGMTFGWVLLSTSKPIVVSISSLLVS